MNKKKDIIELFGLQASVHIGVPDEERQTAQQVLFDLTLQPIRGFDDLQDDIAATVDYYELSRGLQKMAGLRPRKLIETLAVESAEWLLENYPLEQVSVRLRKFILDDAEHVAVCVERSRS